MEHEVLGESERPLTWIKLSRTRWCTLMDLNLGLVRSYGVYVIWDSRQPSRVLRVGHGSIGSELLQCRNDPLIIGHLCNGPLFVTWADVDASDAAGVDLYLSDRLRPLIEGHAPSGVVPLAAERPF